MDSQRTKSDAGTDHTPFPHPTRGHQPPHHALDPYAAAHSRKTDFHQHSRVKVADSIELNPDDWTGIKRPIAGMQRITRTNVVFQAALAIHEVFDPFRF